MPSTSPPRRAARSRLELAVLRLDQQRRQGTEPERRHRFEPARGGEGGEGRVEIGHGARSLALMSLFALRAKRTGARTLLTDGPLRPQRQGGAGHRGGSRHRLRDGAAAARCAAPRSPCSTSTPRRRARRRSGSGRGRSGSAPTSPTRARRWRCGRRGGRALRRTRHRRRQRRDRAADGDHGADDAGRGVAAGPRRQPDRRLGDGAGGAAAGLRARRPARLHRLHLQLRQRPARPAPTRSPRRGSRRWAGRCGRSWHRSARAPASSTSAGSTPSWCGSRSTAATTDAAPASSARSSPASCCAGSPPPRPGRRSCGHWRSGRRAPSPLASGATSPPCGACSIRCSTAASTTTRRSPPWSPRSRQRSSSDSA